MKKALILIIFVFLLTGCSSVMTIDIDKDSITENVKIISSGDAEYNKVKNWNGFPLTLYYDQVLSNPFSSSKEKESGVPYYNVNFNDDLFTTSIEGNFNLKEHPRSSIIRNCFKYYNVVSDGDIYTFSTSHGLICSFTNFDIVVNTPYAIVSNNADSFNEATNSLVWHFNRNNSTGKGVYLELDFSKKVLGEENADGVDSTTDTKKIMNKTILFYVIIIFVMIVLVAIYILKKKKDKSSVI